MATHQQDSVPPAAPSTSASRRRPLGFSIALAGFVLGAILWSFLSVYTVATDEYAVVTAFGNPVTVNASPGLKFKLPYQSVIKFDRRLNILTPGIGEYLTLEKTPVVASATILWRIAEPRQFLRTVFAKAGAESRLADMLSSQLGAAIGREPLGAFVSTDPAAYRADAVIAAVAAGCRDIALRDYGIDVVDVQLQRLDFPERNRLSVFARMKSERMRISMQYRAEGEEEGLKIRAAAEQEKSSVLAEAYKTAQQSRGEGDAEAARIYAQALNRAPDFYRFTRALDATRKSVGPDTTLVLPLDAEPFRLLQDSGAYLAKDGHPPATHAPEEVMPTAQ